MEDNYNSEPVFYCKHCLSLAIVDEGFVDCCAKCGSTAVGEASLEMYDQLHLAKYGTKVFYK